MPNRLAATPVRNGLINGGGGNEQLQLYASAVINGGMVTQTDQVDLKENEVTLAVNTTIRYDVTSRRTGFLLATPVKPNTNKVLALVSFKQFSGGVQFFRFTKNSIHARSGTWVAITGAALNGTDTSQIQFLSVNNRAFFSNQVDALQEINVGANTYAVAGDAKKYKYYCTFAGRIVGANLGGGSASPIEVGWCGDNNFTEWDPLVDISAGFTPLVDSPQDFSDFITGLRSFANNLLVMRERSIWLAVRQASATNPYYFYNAVPGIGCDTPRSIAQIPNGVAWFDKRLGNVYAYVVSPNSYNQQPPEAIGDPIKKSLVGQVVDPNLVFSGYDSINDEYVIGFPVASSTIVKVWKFNFKTRAWCYDEMQNVASYNAMDYTSNSGTIADLVGTIASLTGFIANLSPSLNKATVFFGRTDGDILQASSTVNTDAGAAYTTDIRSKVFKLNPIDTYIAQLHIEYVPQAAGSFTIAYSKDGGDTFHDYKTISFTLDNVGERLTAVCTKNIRNRSYMWRVYSSAGVFDLVEYSAFVFPSAGYTRAKTT